MIYALTTTIAVGVLLLLLLAGAVLLARRAAGEGWPSIGRWRWYPSPLGLLLLLPIAALLLWRFFPAFLFIPLILPFFLRGRRVGRPFFFVRRPGRRGSSSNGRHSADERPIEGQYRPLDDE